MAWAWPPDDEAVGGVEADGEAERAPALVEARRGIQRQRPEVEGDAAGDGVPLGKEGARKRHLKRGEKGGVVGQELRGEGRRGRCNGRIEGMIVVEACTGWATQRGRWRRGYAELTKQPRLRFLRLGAEGRASSAGRREAVTSWTTAEPHSPEAAARRTAS